MAECWRVVKVDEIDQWAVVAGDYPDEPDAVVLVAHSVDADGDDTTEALAHRIVAALSGVSSPTEPAETK